MTTAESAPSRLLADRDERPALSPLAALRRAWTDQRTYRRSLAELRAMSIRQREDLGFAGLDLEAITHAATYRP